MAIPWTGPQSDRVGALIGAHPPDGGRCADLARAILPIARDLDGNAHGCVIRPLPGHGRYVAPRVGGTMWRHHVTVGVAAHFVDALTDVPGTPSADYPDAHWLHADALSIKPDDLEDPCL